MAWYEITTGGDLSVIPQTQAPSVNALLPAANGLLAGKPPKKPAATNAAVVYDSDANAPTNAASPAGKAVSATGKGAAKAATNTTKSDIPL
jgi:hypothetical protein